MMLTVYSLLNVPSYSYYVTMFSLSSTLLSCYLFLSVTFVPSPASKGEGNANPPQCSCLENPVDRGAWWAAVYGVAQSQIRLKWLSSSSSLPLILGKAQPLQGPDSILFDVYILYFRGFLHPRGFDHHMCAVGSQMSHLVPWPWELNRASVLYL